MTPHSANSTRSGRRLKISITSTAWLAAIVQSSCEAIISKTLDGTITSWNPGAERLYGYTESEMVGRPISALVPAGRVDEVSELLVRLSAGEHIERYETLRQRKNGQIFPVSLTISTIKNAEGTILGASIIARDMTEARHAPCGYHSLERRGAEQHGLGHLHFLESLDQINRAVQSTHDLEQMMMAVLDVALSVFECDRAWLVYPVDPATTTFRVPMERSRPDYAGTSAVGQDVPVVPDIAQVFKTLLASKGPVTFGPESENPLPPGMARAFNIQSQIVTAIYPRTDKPYAFGLHQCSYPRVWTPEESRLFQEVGRRLADGLSTLLAYRDLRESEQALRRLSVELEQRVTERTAALKSANYDLEALYKELESFSYSVSHDLRAPLRGIDGLSQVLLEDYATRLDDEGRHYLQRIRSGTQRMAQLIDDLLNLSRLTGGKIRVQKVNLSNLVREITGEFSRSEPERNVTITIAPEVVVAGDARLLKVVLENLIGNAWKFTSKCREARIEFGQMRQEDRLVFFVRDNGAGFDMNYAGRLFAPFQRLHGDEEFPGTGIGLATVQRILRRHGGRIWAESSVGQGATFYLTLP